jgi:hypothetical protein
MCGKVRESGKRMDAMLMLFPDSAKKSNQAMHGPQIMML